MGALTTPVILLLLMEVCLRLVGYGYPTTFFLKSKVGGQPVLVENDKIAWSYFPPGLARSPQPLVLPRVKRPDTCRIFVLGESAAMGDPEPAFGLARTLEVILQAQYPSKHFEVVNVAMTAINSHVIRNIARDCASCDGDLWVLYMGNNEVVGPFGAGTVFGWQTPNRWLIDANLALRSTRVGQLFDACWHKLVAGKPAEWQGMEMFLKQQVRADDPRMEAVYRHFQKNLQEILQMASACGAKVLLSTVSSNLKDCPPFASLHRADLTDTQRAEWEKVYQSGIKAEAATHYAEALTYYEEAAKIDHSYAELAFRQGRCRWGLSQFAAARRSFELARDLDTLRFRADTRINEIIRQSAAAFAADSTHTRDHKEGSKEVKLFDAVELFAQNSPHDITGEQFLFEHVHLNFSGNHLLAQALAGAIEAGWPNLLGNAARGASDFISMEECGQRLALTDWDRYQVLDEISKRLGQPPFTQQLDREEREERLAKARAALKPGIGSDGLAKAAEIYRQAIMRAPTDWVLRENYAKLLQSSGDPRGAETQWRQVLELVPQHEEAYYSLGNVLDGQGKSAEAIKYLQLALRRRPDSLEARNGLGLALASQGKIDEAQREYEAALRRKPEFSEARVNLGQILAEQGKIDEAMRQYEAALRFNSNSVAAHINLGKLLALQKNLNAAAEHYAAAVRLNPDNAVAHYNLGNALSSLGKSDEAASQFTEAIRCQPDFAEAYHNLGLELAKRGQTTTALEKFSKAVELNPGFAEAHFNLGVALAKERRFDEAILQFQETLRLEPGNAAARKFLDQAMLLRNKKS